LSVTTTFWKAEESAVPQVSNGRQPQKPERSQSPLWFAIAGLVICIASFGMKDQMVADVVFWFGAVCALIGMLYWFFRPRHGFH